MASFSIPFKLQCCFLNKNPSGMNSPAPMIILNLHSLESSILDGLIHSSLSATFVILFYHFFIHTLHYNTFFHYTTLRLWLSCRVCIRPLEYTQFYRDRQTPLYLKRCVTANSKEGVKLIFCKIIGIHSYNKKCWFTARESPLEHFDLTDKELCSRYKFQPHPMFFYQGNPSAMQKYLPRAHIEWWHSLQIYYVYYSNTICLPCNNLRHTIFP